MKRSITLLKLRPDLSDGSKETLTPPVGLWSMRENSFDWKVTVFDLSLQDRFVVDQHIGYSISFPAQARTLPLLRTRTLALQGEVLGGPCGGLMTELPSHYGDGESFLAGRKVLFSELEPPRFSGAEMFPYWISSRPFGRVTEEKWMPLETSRGCPCSCSFCAMPSFWGSWEARPLEVLDDYLHYLARAHSIKQVIFLDDNVSLKKERFLHILESLKSLGLSWSCPNGIYARTLLDPEVAKEVLSSNCVSLSLPFETGNYRSASLMGIGRKYFPFEEARNLVESFRGKVHLTGFFIIGYPGEDERDVRDTLKYANSLPLDERYIYFATPYAGTRLHEEALPFMEVPLENATYKVPVIGTPSLSRERLLELWREDRIQAGREGRISKGK